MSMKKNYFKPEVSAVDIILENFMLGGSVIEGDNNENDDQDNWATNRNRGEWGNVWGK